uniref:Uncharacterized protein n=1 Tax=Mesocestoides corti TaxID=53468 RepID=A0A5K3EHN1_MESCO
MPPKPFAVFYAPSVSELQPWWASESACDARPLAGQGTLCAAAAFPKATAQTLRTCGNFRAYPSVPPLSHFTVPQTVQFLELSAFEFIQFNVFLAAKMLF